MSDRDLLRTVEVLVMALRADRRRVHAEILDLCDAIDQQLIGYDQIAGKLRAIVGGEDE